MLTRTADALCVCCRLPREVLFTSTPLSAWKLLTRGAVDCSVPAPRELLIERIGLNAYEVGLAALRKLGWAIQTAAGWIFRAPGNPFIDVLDPVALTPGTAAHRMYLVAQTSPRARNTLCWERLLHLGQSTVYAGRALLRKLGLMEPDGSLSPVDAEDLPEPTAPPTPKPKKRSLVGGLAARAIAAGIQVIQGLPKNVKTAALNAHNEWMQAGLPNLGGPDDTPFERAALIIYGHAGYLNSYLQDQATTYTQGTLADIISTLRAISDPDTHLPGDGARLQRVIAAGPNPTPFDTVLESIAALHGPRKFFTYDPKVLFRVTETGLGWDQFVLPELQKARKDKEFAGVFRSKLSKAQVPPEVWHLRRGDQRREAYLRGKEEAKNPPKPREPVLADFERRELAVKAALYAPALAAGFTEDEFTEGLQIMRELHRVLQPSMGKPGFDFRTFCAAQHPTLRRLQAVLPWEAIPR